MFDRLVGNHQIKAVLKRFLLKERVPNALLFAGDDGIGKRQFALELARAHLCSGLADGEGCGVCSQCHRIKDIDIPEPTDKNKDEFKKVFFGEHLDVGQVVAYKRLILVDAIRDLERNANYRPYEAPARFFIVDDAEKMNDQAANALLKTLEEPPPTTHIFLITSRPDSLLPTIRSRCQTLRFAPVSADEIERYLVEDRAFSQHDARLAARLARGSIGRAVSINVQKFCERREKMLSVIAAAIETGDRGTMLQIGGEMNDAKNKEAFEENIGILESLIHDVWSLAVTQDRSRVVNTDLADQLAALAKYVRSPDLPVWLADIQTMRENLVVNINRKIATDALFVSMAAA
jgi:DNA polymerase III subunit delta'